METGLQENCHWDPRGPEASTKTLANQNGIPEILLLGAKPHTNAVLLFLPLRFLDGCPGPGALWTRATVSSKGPPDPGRTLGEKGLGKASVLIFNSPSLGCARPAEVIELWGPGSPVPYPHIQTSWGVSDRIVARKTNDQTAKELGQ